MSPHLTWPKQSPEANFCDLKHEFGGSLRSGVGYEGQVHVRMGDGGDGNTQLPSCIVAQPPEALALGH